MSEDHTVLISDKTNSAMISIVDESGLLAPSSTYLLQVSATDLYGELSKTIQTKFVTPGFVIPYVLASSIHVQQEPGIVTVDIPPWRRSVNNGGHC